MNLIFDLVIDLGGSYKLRKFFFKINLPSLKQHI